MADQLGHGWGKSDVLRNDIASDSRHPASCSVPIENLSTELTEAHHCNGLEDGERNTYPKGMRLFTIILAIALSMFLIALDQGIVANAVPRITDQFHSVNDIGWYGSGYLLMTTLQLFYGKLFSVFSVKTVFAASIVLFEAGSLICGLAPSSLILIIGRVIAGMGGSGVYSGGFILLAQTVPLTKRPLYAALDSATFGLGSVTGPLLGGIFTDKLSWRWCFYINLPFGVFSVIIILLMVQPSNIPGSLINKNIAKVLFDLDTVSIAFLMGSLGCSLVFLQWGGLHYAWDDPRLIGLYVVTAGMFFAFLWIQRYIAAPQSSLPRQIVRQRSIAAGCIYYLGFGGSFMPLTYLLPIWFQTVKGTSAFNSGIRTLPMVLAYVLSSICGGIVVNKFGYYKPLLITSSVLMAVGAGLISVLKPDSGPAAWIGFQILYGTGLGFGADLPLVAAQAVLSQDDIPKATALLILFQTLSATLFISVCDSIFIDRLSFRLQNMLPSFDRRMLVETGAVSLISRYEAKDNTLFLGAYNEALADAFIVSVVLASTTILGSLIIENRSVKTRL